eukprot:gene7116-11279_t
MFYYICMALVILYILIVSFMNGGRKRKGEPHLLKGYIPFLGVFPSIMMKGYYPFVKECEKKFGSIFSFYFLGIRTHILTNVSDFPLIHKNTKGFTMYPILDDISKRENQIVRPDEEKKNLTTQFLKSFQGDSLNQITKDYQTYALQKINEIFESEGGKDEIEVNFFDFSRTVVYHGSTKAIMGDQFDAKGTEEDFFEYDASFQLIFIGMHLDWLSKAKISRKKVTDHINSLDFQKMSNFIQDAAYSISEEPTTESITNVAMGALVASQINSVNGAFWGFLNILNNPEVRKEVEKEIKEKFNFDKYEDSLNNMPYLHACFTETTRFSTTGVSLRAATRDETIQVEGKKYNIRKGDQLYLFPTAYDDEEIFPNPKKFDPTRYLTTDPKKLKIFKEILIPFGGGIHYCPGRFFAVNEMKVLTIMMLTQFDCELPSSNPKIVAERIQLGFQRPLHNLKLKIKKKK